MTKALRIGVLTSLYPTPDRPFEGIFAQRRWSGMAARGHDIRVVQPTPKVPWPLGSLFPSRFGDLARRPGTETQGDITIQRPRYRHISKRAVGNAQRFAQAGLDVLVTSDWKPDVVVCDYAWPAGAAAPLCQALGIPVILSGRGSDVLEVGGEAGLHEELGAYLRAAGRWIAVSMDLVRAMDRLAGTEAGILVPNGVDAELFHPLQNEARKDLRQELGWSPDEKVVLLVGHLIPRKDPLLALESFAAFHSTCPKSRLLVIGKGGLRQQLEEAAAQAGLSDQVEMLGERQAPELSRMYGAADGLLLCSSREGRPNVVLEALSCGLPVVATDAGGTGELLAPGPFSTVQSRDAKRIGECLRQTLDNPPTRAEVAQSVASLSWSSSLDILEDVLHRHMEALHSTAEGPGPSKGSR